MAFNENNGGRRVPERFTISETIGEEIGRQAAAPGRLTSELLPWRGNFHMHRHPHIHTTAIRTTLQTQMFIFWVKWECREPSPSGVCFGDWGREWKQKRKESGESIYAFPDEEKEKLTFPYDLLRYEIDAWTIFMKKWVPFRLETSFAPTALPKQNRKHCFVPSA